MTNCCNDSASLSKFGVLSLLCATMTDICSEIFAKKGYVGEQITKFNDLISNNESRCGCTQWRSIRCTDFISPKNEDVTTRLKQNVIWKINNGQRLVDNISPNNNVVKEDDISRKATLPRHQISKKNNKPARPRIYSDKGLCKLSTSSNDISTTDVDESRKAIPPKKDLISMKGKKPARRKTDPYNDFDENSTGFQQYFQRSVSDPGSGNLPSFELLGLEQSVNSFEHTTVANDDEVKSNGEKHDITNTDNLETCRKNDIIENILVITSDDEHLNANKGDVLGYDLITSDGEISNTVKECTHGGQISDKEKEVVSPSCESTDLVTEVVYTHEDVDFLNSIEHTEPTEILYATRLDVNALKDIGVSDQTNCNITDLADECSTKIIENDDELCEVVEELRKGTDFRNTITDTQTPSCSTSPDSPSTESHDNDQYFSLNFAEGTDECIAEASDEELEINLETFESDLQEAMEESVKSKSITPIIKKELQFKIQCKRLENGEDELEVEFSQPKKYQLTEDEIRKVNARREQNRRSAKKGRLKAKQKERHLTQILNKASSSIAKLRREVVELRSMKTDLLQKLKSHFQHCQLFTLIEQQKKFLASSGF